MTPNTHSRKPPNEKHVGNNALHDLEPDARTSLRMTISPSAFPFPELVETV
ncbi:hypothetical protein J2T09_001595 [Neorhizobium huautlense]|uniref:Uncharacterized protein n=1 Tax=Neorhizobium huautlense TaxID=67774 RepID=A0ABT9PQV5_9HYPH|nr:hypothetical protein [Neorhizobium huautlense]MDP9836850.1 hypothetical protein [Neorhizobium huautlense]